MDKAMAEILFGKPTLRLRVQKLWRRAYNPLPLHGTNIERKNYIYKIKKELKLEEYLKHSNRKMTNGASLFYKHPTWTIRPKLKFRYSSPNHFPMEIFDSIDEHLDDTPYLAKVIEKEAPGTVDPENIEDSIENYLANKLEEP